MNHKWKRIDSWNGVCEICGCQREIIYPNEYIYCRSGMIPSTKCPDCIDWEEEDKKEID